MEDRIAIKFKIPRQDLPALSLFEPSAEAAKTWAQTLPFANASTAGQSLIQALNDLNRMQLSPEVRYSIIEMLRPKIDETQSALSKGFLNQPLVMPKASQVIADLSDRLLSLSSTAYTIVAIETVQKPKAIRATNPGRLACQTIHRALVFAGRIVVQRFQLHQPININGWETLNQLYGLAINHRLADLRVPEPLLGGNTITAAYLQAVMIGCCKPNQLLQGDLATLYHGLQHWSELIKLEPDRNDNSLFIVDLSSAQPPVYSAFYQEPPTPQCRFINCTRLLRRLEVLRKETGTQGLHFDDNTYVSANLFDHIIMSLSSVSLRNFKRSASNRPLWMCIGLSSTHYHVAGKRLFEDLVEGDVHQLEQLTVDGPFRPPDLSPDERYPIFKGQLTDTSPGGYCVEWPSGSPCKIKAGEVVGLKEEEGQQEWVIAVIRWLSRLEDAKTLLGVELLSPRAVAYGASIHHKGGKQTKPIRVLLLPEVKLVDKPNTLLTPCIGFREHQKLTIDNSAERHDIQLLRHKASRGAFDQFQFCYTKSLGDVLAESQQGQMSVYYDSLWSKI